MNKLMAALAAAALAGAASADPGSAATRDYLAAAGQSDAFEMLEASTALTASRDPAVRSYAERMLRDHHATSAALAQAAARSGLKPPPAGLGADQAPLLAALQSLKEPAFDRAYWRQQALGHRSALTATQRYAATGDDPAVRAAAAAAVPVITAHLATAERMAAQAGGG